MSIFVPGSLDTERGDKMLTGGFSKSDAMEACRSRNDRTDDGDTSTETGAGIGTHVGIADGVRRRSLCHMRNVRTSARSDGATANVAGPPTRAISHQRRSTRRVDSDGNGRRTSCWHTANAASRDAQPAGQARTTTARRSVASVYDEENVEDSDRGTTKKKGLTNATVTPLTSLRLAREKEG
ncbi:hypothetical protein OSTOST_08788 [Ostertagia ostertagi]